MYAVIRYFNYRKNVSFAILKTFKSLKRADKYALQCAEEDYGEEEVVQGVDDSWIEVHNEVIDGYTKNDGYDKFVYSVIKFDEPDDNEDDSSNSDDDDLKGDESDDDEPKDDEP